MRAGAVILVTVLMTLMAGTLLDGDPAPASAARSFQDDGYPVETATLFVDPGYPVESETPIVSPTTFLPTSALPTSVSPTTSLPALTLTTMATQPPNTFLTENAEQAGGMLTPVVTETPGPTITPFSTATLTGVTPQPTRTPQTKDQSGSNMDWGLFWIGFSLPVLSGSGYVLYLLDRRPDLFRRP